MAVSGPDRGYSWAIVFCCAYIHFALFGIFRSAGVVYVALLKSFDVTREEASWPFSLCSAVFQLSAPLVSVLILYLSQRTVCLFGSAIATAGLVGCYFAKSVCWINIFYGLVHGFGFGIVVTLIPVYLNNYFVKHRATAIGIAFSGGTVSSFIFPVVVEWLVENYSLNGSFLLLGGMVMNTLVASSLLRSPPWLKKNKKQQVAQEEARDSGVSTSDAEDELKIPADPIACSPVRIRRESSGPLDDSAPAGDELPSAQTTATSETVYSNNDSLLFNGSGVKMNDHVATYKTLQNHSDIQKPLLKDNPLVIVPMQRKEKPTGRWTFKCMVPHSVVDILKQPMFHLISFTMGIYFLGVHLFFMVIVDFAQDKGISEGKGIYILSMFSLTDLIGRAGFGWVTDKNYVKRKHMIIGNLFVIGLINQLYPLIGTLVGLLVVSAFHGLAVGTCISLFFVLQAEYLGMKKLTLVIGLTSFMNGAITLLRPSMIGLFRDIIGSYNWMFHSLGIIAILFSMIWIIESRMAAGTVSPHHTQNGRA